LPAHAGRKILRGRERRDVLFELFENLVREVNLVALPGVGPDRHVLDEAQLEAASRQYCASGTTSCSVKPEC